MNNISAQWRFNKSLFDYWPEALIICVAIGLRIFWLEAKPPHFDEGVNGWFADQMSTVGYYRYDPTNYHGPFYFYLVYLFKELFGRELWALRMPAVIGSILAVFWMLRFAEFFGRRVAGIAAIAMAVSPAYVFYGRYSIHESWLVFFAMVFIWGFLGIWRRGTARYLYATAIGFSGLVVTKETWVITILATICAFGVLFLWQKIVPSQPNLPWAQKHWSAKDALIGVGVVFVAVFLFYSGFFQNFSGVSKFFGAFSAWSETGFEGVSGHEKKEWQIGFLNYYWLYLIVRYEWPVLLGFIACLPLIGRAPAQRRFLALYAVGVLCAYSIIPYKTPWLIISILWPFFLLFGGGVDDLLRFVTTPIRKAWMGLLFSLPILISFIVCSRLNFFHMTDEKEPYVYVQTDPEIARLTDPVLSLARHDARNYGLRGMILLESYYPIPWVLGDFSQIGYYNKKEIWPSTIDADFVAVLASDADIVQKRMREPYYKRNFRLRSGMRPCIAYFQASVFRQYFGGNPEFVPER